MGFLGRKWWSAQKCSPESAARGSQLCTRRFSIPPDGSTLAASMRSRPVTNGMNFLKTRTRFIITNPLDSMKARFWGLKIMGSQFHLCYTLHWITVHCHTGVVGHSNINSCQAWKYTTPYHYEKSTILFHIFKYQFIEATSVLFY